MIFDNILNCERYAKYDSSLERAFDFIKKHYNIVKKICGLILVIMGIYVMFK